MNQINQKQSTNTTFKLILDPDGDGTSWLYREMSVQEQRHPQLLPYACYDVKRDWFLIGVTVTKKGSKELINRYIADGKDWSGYEIYPQ